MLVVFLFTGIIAAVFMIVVVKILPPAQGISFNLPSDFTAPPPASIGDQIVGIFTVPDFMQLFSREHILALIFFAVLIGMGVTSLGEKGKGVAQLLQAGTEISMKAVSFVMYYAPIGFFAYFAVLVAERRTQTITNLFVCYDHLLCCFHYLFYFCFHFLCLACWRKISSKNSIGKMSLYRS